MTWTLARFETLEAYVPTPLETWEQLTLAFFVLVGFIVVRYFLLVGGFWVYFYRWRPSSIARRLLYPKLPGAAAQWYEIRWSVLSSLIFGAVGVLIGVLWLKGWTRIYLRFDEYGLIYLFLSPLLLALLHDAYFYWTHRWLHIPAVFRRYHRVHHESLHPSPWASFSFHPVESVVNALALPLLVVLLPLHPLVLLFHLILMTVTAILNHLGYETLPRWTLKTGIARWWISGLHHAQHHRQFNTNYALFFSFWDHWAGTENKSFERELAAVFDQKPERPSSD